MRTSTPQRLTFLCLNLFLCAFILTAVAVAQTQTNKQYTENKPDLGLRADARIDPSTLAMSLEIPLGGAPGRAGTSVSSVLRYSSKQWRMNYAGIYPSPTLTHTLTRLKFSEDAMAGWTSSLDAPWIEYTGRKQRFDCSNGSPMSDDPNAVYNDVCFIARIHLHLPDGSSHELRKSDTPQVFVITNPQPDFTGTFYSTDGARMRFDSDAGVLYTPDGGRYIFGAEQYGTRYNHQELSWRWATQYIDRNGNTLSYSLASVSDTLGRAYANPLANTPTVQDQTYSLPGFNGQSLSYTLRWRNLADALSTTVALGYTSSLKCTAPNQYQSVSPWLYESTGGFTHICADDQVFNPVVLAEVVLPNGRSYQLKYNRFGEIDKIIYPTGGYERFNYAKVSELARSNWPYDLTNRGVVDRWVSVSGNGSDETHWTYVSTGLTSAHKVAITPPDGSRTERVMYASNSSVPASYGFDNPLVGMIYEEAVFNSSNQMLQRTLTDWATETPSGSTRPRNPRVARTTSLTLVPGSNALAATTTMQYDGDVNVIATNHYDFVSVDSTTAQTGAIGSISVGSLLRTDETTYLVNDTAIDAGIRSNYRARNLVGLPSSSRVKNGVGTIVAQSSVSYDEATYPLLTYGSITAWSDPGANVVRGNPTTTNTWVDTTNSWLQTHAQYDQAGNLRNSWDARGNQSQVEYSSTYAYAFPTLTRSAVPDPTAQYGSTSALVSTTVYDFNTGLVTSTTDANNQTTTMEYNDSLRRLTRINSPDGGYKTNTYVDSHPCGPFVETKALLETGRETDSWQFFDGVGRPYLAESFDGQDANNPYLRVDTQYDSMGRAWRVSNPYRTAGCSSTLNPSGRWTQSAFDALGRVTSVTTPDSAVVTSSYSGNTVTVTDQAGKARKSVTDALGRLAQVYEDPNGVNYLTSYTYDVLGNLRRVDQGSQQRFFMYDSLSRLIRAKNPEQSAGSVASNITDPITGNTQWSMAYGYDNNGNLTARVDARNVTTTYAYDALNRNTTVRYTDGTKDIDRHYDNPTANKNGLGRMWYSNWDPTNNTRFDSHLAIDQYDAMGRPVNYRQHFLTNGIASPQFNVTRTYDKAGDVLTQTYPSGHTVNYSYDLAGRLTSDTGNLGDGVSRSYATGFSYSEFGGIQQEQFGTQTALYHKLHYNVRGQMYDMRLSTSSWASDEWNWNRGALLNWYDSTSNFPYQNPSSGTNNNGNVLRQEIFVPDNDQISSYSYRRQNYAYDSLNRLASVTEYANGTTQSFVQAYAYDRFGNRTIDQTQTSASVPHPNYTADTSNNRLIAPAGYNYGYDNAGNQTNDNYTGQGQRTYDGENRLKQAQGTPNNQWQTYTYDADGRRLKRNVNGVETWAIYGMDGELLAEYASGAAPFLPTTEYGYRNGELLVTIANGDTQRLTRFVTNLYYGALQRDPTSQELTDKVNQLATAGATGQSQLLTTASQIARSLFTVTNYETSPYRFRRKSI